MSTFKPKKYVSWRPNDSFVKFFEDMRERKISAADSPAMMRVTDMPPPQSSPYKVKQRHPQPPQGQKSTKRKAVTRGSRGGDDEEDEKKRKKQKSSKAEKNSSRKYLTSLEKRIRDHSFL